MSEVKPTDIYIESDDFKLILRALNMATLMQLALEEEESRPTLLRDLDDNPIPAAGAREVIAEGHKAAGRAKYRP